MGVKAATYDHIADLLYEANRIQQQVMDGAECNRIHNLLSDLVEQFEELAEKDREGTVDI